MIKPQYSTKVMVIGAGMAGSDASFFLAENGISVILVESKRIEPNPAQKLDTAGELVCTNSLKSKDPTSAHGMLKYEMTSLGSLIIKTGLETQVPAGNALAVDRVLFGQKVHEALTNHPLITFVDEVVTDPLELAKKWGCEFCIVATGPLTSKSMEDWISQNLSKDDFYFYDAIAPVVDAESLDLTEMYFKDRYQDDKIGDYLNVPLNKDQYDEFVEDLVKAEKVPAKDFEKLQFFESCLPIDIMAERGRDTLRFGPMKPVGLRDKNGVRPYAVVQLRRENLLGDAYNLVGFQTRLTYKEQNLIFKKLPGFKEASFIHLGSVHRNSFLNARKLLNPDLSTKEFSRLFFAGQIIGVEGYTESASMGLVAAIQILRRIQGKDPIKWPVETGIGALINYIMTVERPTPSNINFGLIPPMTIPKQKLKRVDRKKMRNLMLSERAKEVFDKLLRESEFTSKLFTGL